MLPFDDKLAYEQEAPRESLEDILAFYLEPDEIEALQEQLEAYGYRMGGEFIRRLAVRLRETKHGLSLARAIGIGGDETLEESAEHFGVSPQWLSKLQKEAELLLGDEFTVKSLETVKRPSLGNEDYYDINDAAKVLSLTRTEAKRFLVTKKVKVKRGAYGSHLYKKDDIKSYRRQHN